MIKEPGIHDLPLIARQTLAEQFNALVQPALIGFEYEGIMTQRNCVLTLGHEEHFLELLLGQIDAIVNQQVYAELIDQLHVVRNLFD